MAVVGSSGSQRDLEGRLPFHSPLHRISYRLWALSTSRSGGPSVSLLGGVTLKYRHHSPCTGHVLEVPAATLTSWWWTVCLSCSHPTTRL